MGIALFQLLTSTQGPDFWGKCPICSYILQSSCPLRAVREPQCMWICSTVKQPWHSNKHIASLFCPGSAPGFAVLKSFLHDCCWLCFLHSVYLMKRDVLGAGGTWKTQIPPSFDWDCPPWPLSRHSLYPLLLSGIGKSRKHIYLINGLAKMKSSNDCKRLSCCMVKIV